MEQARVTEFKYVLGKTVLEYTLDDIVAFESSHKYTEVILRNNERRPILDVSLIELEKRYADLFVRSHRGVLVRRDAVVRMVRMLSTGVYDVHLDNGHVSPISRREKGVIRNVIKQNELNNAMATLIKEAADAQKRD